MNGNSGNWTDPVWYILDHNTGVRHRYLFTKSVKGERRESKDILLLNNKNYDSIIHSEPYLELLKIYTLEVQSASIVNNSKQYRVVVASHILTEAEKLGGLNNVPLNFWNSIPMSNIFWDFCTKNKLIVRKNRPSHTDRERGADIYRQRSEKQLKMTPDSMIYALGDIFTQVFCDIDEDGNLLKGGHIKLDEAVSMTTVLLGLAAPNRLNSEIPLLQNQRLKVLHPKTGNEVYYLDWPGSKGYLDNQNHILKVLAPQVKRAIGFFNLYLKPERHFIRYLKNPNQTWEAILKGFNVEKERANNIDFSTDPNIFTVAYSLGFYPVNYEVDTLSTPDAISITENSKKWRFNSFKWCKSRKRRLSKKDFLIRKSIGRICPSDLILNLTGSNNALYSVQRVLYCSCISKKFKESLDLPFLITAYELENSVIRMIYRDIPKFPLCYTKLDKGIDLESALFCLSPGKHSITSTKGMAGSPLYILPIKRITHLFTQRVCDKNKTSSNLFNKYGFGAQYLKLHSLRHFSNTQAEKGGIPLSVIAAWSGRKSVNQTLEYIHTSEEEKADRLVSTLDYSETKKEIRLISKDELHENHGLPASQTETGICIQELTVTPCSYVNDFLSGCFGCESACYICGDHAAINVLEQDLKFQKIRLQKIQRALESFISQATKDWWVKHSQGTSLLEQLIAVLKDYERGQLVRIAPDRSCFFITNLNTKHVEKKTLLLTSESELLAALEVESKTEESVPESMRSLIASFGLKNR
ncbi:hypothetical protein [Pseudoalteromonas ardens]|nr:hypothetical protein [Pseudoalteromonas sp. R96]MDK1313646.1 hypothetical protein [Pseudoalteromonas sp. R96]